MSLLSFNHDKMQLAVAPSSHCPLDKRVNGEVGVVERGKNVRVREGQGCCRHVPGQVRQWQ